MPAKKQIINKLKKTPFPGDIKPMLATLTDKPFNSNAWIFEVKWDGYRVISKKYNNNVALSSRNLISFDKLFPTIKKNLASVKGNFVLDGEAVALDESNRPDFQLIQNYKRTGRGTIVYYVFDLLWLNGYNTETLPVIERKHLLKELLPDTENIFYSDHIVNNGIKLFKEVRKLKIEGIIAKKASSEYYENTRSHNWLKIKTEETLDAVICGYTEPRGSRKYFGALILGVYDNDKLIYIGHTGTGFNYTDQLTVFNLLKKYAVKKSHFEKSPKPNAPVTWLKPAVVCEVKYSQVTNEGVLRHPVFMRIRDDKKPEEVTLVSQLKRKNLK